MKNILYTLVLVAAAGSQLGSTDCGQVLRDPGFDLWCGDSLCAWKVERGSIRKVPTWNQGDPGVELDGSDVAIEQLTPVTSSDAGCIQFDLIANVDETAEVDLNIDIFGDGSVEHTERLPTARWKQLSYQLPIQGVYGGIRFEIAKHGPGKAVIAQVEATALQDCPGLVPIEPDPAPDGAVCANAAGCRSGTCANDGGFGGVCAGCTAAGPACPAGQVCGLGDPTSPVFEIPQQCVPAGARQLGENCELDAECATGMCEAGACSTCRSAADCAPGETCGPDWTAGTAAWHTPYLCNPDGHQRATGEPCASNADCASGRCNGPARLQCDDGRRCATAADCPFDGPGTSNGLQNGACNDVGVQGGSCQ